ncbi:MAG: HAMP domain-containing histidine kinase [Lachnospiraceae bacterium]|nr:HAMP domain-containing histidine kinase [Lachnospiraceae bacterium]
MSEQSIQRLKNKFITTAMLSFFIVMTFIATCIYYFNHIITRHQIRETLEYIVDNEGVLPTNYENIETQEGGDNVGQVLEKNELITQLEKFFGAESEYFSEDFYYATRYFAVLYDENGEVMHVVTSHMAAIESEQALLYANTVMNRWFTFGSFDDFYYMVDDLESGGKIVVILDCGTQISISRRIVQLACILIGFGMCVSLFIIRSWASRIVQPEIQNAELQKSFITNASHELKTPLAVIRANTEMVEMVSGENEWTKSTLAQVDRLTGLIQNLVMVTRANENDSKADRTQIDFSAIANDTLHSYEAVAIQEQKTLTGDILPEITILAHEGDIRQITTLLIDNAIKYCDEQGEIRVVLRKNRKGKLVQLLVSNSYAGGEGVDYSRFFDRFYRGDESHNVDKEGYGIGLSIAQGLMNRYHGGIDVAWKDGIITFICTFHVS